MYTYIVKVSNQLRNAHRFQKLCHAHKQAKNNGSCALINVPPQLKVHNAKETILSLLCDSESIEPVILINENIGTKFINILKMFRQRVP